MQDARNFIFSSDYSMPRLIWSKSVSLENIEPYGYKEITIPHGFSFTPLLIGIWSENSDFDPAYDISNFSGTAVVHYTVQLDSCGADNNNIHVRAFSLTNQTTNVYLRLMAFAPPEASGSIDTLSDETKFEFSTDYIYPKIVKEGFLDISSGATQVIKYDLGYIPQAKVWGPDSYGYVGPMTRERWPSSYERTCGPTITSSTLSITARTSGKHYYHIYGDEI